MYGPLSTNSIVKKQPLECRLKNLFKPIFHCSVIMQFWLGGADEAMHSLVTPLLSTIWSTKKIYKGSLLLTKLKRIQNYQRQSLRLIFLITKHFYIKSIKHGQADETKNSCSYCFNILWIITLLFALDGVVYIDRVPYFHQLLKSYFG